MCMELFPYLHGTFVELRPRAGIPYLLQPEFDEIIVDPVLWICLCYHLSNISPLPWPFFFFFFFLKDLFKTQRTALVLSCWLDRMQVFFLFLLKTVVLKFKVKIRGQSWVFHSCFWDTQTYAYTLWCSLVPVKTVWWRISCLSSKVGK